MGNTWLSVEEAAGSLHCTEAKILELAYVGKLRVMYRVIVHQRLPRRSSRKPYFLMTDVDRVALDFAAALAFNIKCDRD